MCQGSVALHAFPDFLASPPSDVHIPKPLMKRPRLNLNLHHRLDVPSLLSRLKVALFMSLWFVFSVASLFIAKHTLHVYHLNEAVFSLTQFALSVVFGLLFTKVFRFHPLTSLRSSELRSIVPLSTTFLVKELLKYAALSRVSVNLVNTIRSLGPLFNVLLELLFLGHRPPRSVLWALAPIVVGVALTSIDEIHHASASVNNSLLVAIAGFVAAVLSTGINNGQNIYSKILFGRERIDPVSLQIYLSAISFALMTPFTSLQLAYQAVEHARAQTDDVAPLAWLWGMSPPGGAVAAVVVAGLVNFIASQLAFNTLRLVTPLSYSVANTFKRVAIAVIAIFYFSERLSPVNGVGIAISIGGVVLYERKARALREASQYRRVDGVGVQQTSAAARPHGKAETAGVIGMPSRKQTASGPDLLVLACEADGGNGGATASVKVDSSGTAGAVAGGGAVHRHLYIDVATSPTAVKTHVMPTAEAATARI